MKNIICNVLLLALYLGFFVHDGETSLFDEPTVEPIIGRFIHGESPQWHFTDTLSFVDTVAQKVCMYNIAEEELVCAVLENGPVGFAVSVNNAPGKFVAGSGKDIVLVDMPNEAGTQDIQAKTLITIDPKANGTRWNDAKADSSGRLWAGTIGPEKNEHVSPNEAAFYRIDSDLFLQKELSNVTNSNGLVWNKNEDTLYYIDSATHQVAAFDFDSTKGSISNKRIVFDLENTEYSGILDGMTIDTDENLWIALYNGSGILNVNPLSGEVIQFVELPVSKPTSCVFGGIFLDVLYVTTCSRDLSEQELREQPLAGFVLAVKGLGVSGNFPKSFTL